MNSQRADSLRVSCFVFGVWYENITLFRYVRTLNTKNKIRSTGIKTCFSVFCRISIFTLYKDFGLCYLILFLEMKNNGVFMRSNHEEERQRVF